MKKAESLDVFITNPKEMSYETKDYTLFVAEWIIDNPDAVAILDKDFDTVEYMQFVKLLLIEQIEKENPKYVVRILVGRSKYDMLVPEASQYQIFIATENQGFVSFYYNEKKMYLYIDCDKIKNKIYDEKSGKRNLAFNLPYFDNYDNIVSSFHPFGHIVINNNNEICFVVSQSLLKGYQCLYLTKTQKFGTYKNEEVFFNLPEDIKVFRPIEFFKHIYRKYGGHGMIDYYYKGNRSDEKNELFVYWDIAEPDTMIFTFEKVLPEKYKKNRLLESIEINPYTASASQLDSFKLKLEYLISSSIMKIKDYEDMQITFGYIYKQYPSTDELIKNPSLVDKSSLSTIAFSWDRSKSNVMSLFDAALYILGLKKYQDFQKDEQKLD